MVSMLALGRDVTTGEAVPLSADDRKQGTYVVGINGTGKSTLLLNIALADIQAGDGLCMLDPHGDLIEKLLLRVPAQRVADVILFDPADIEFPFGLNLFECADTNDPMQVDRVCSEAIGTFYKLFSESWGPHMEDLLRNTALTLIENPGATMADIPRLLTDPVYRATFVDKVQNEEVRGFWEYTYNKQRGRDLLEYNRSTLNKVRRFLLNKVIRNIVGQPQSSIDLRRIMDEGKILLVNLSKGRLGEDNSALLGSILIGKILVAALSRANIREEERRAFHLIVDEYQSFAGSSFPTLQSEARKFNIDTIVAHQYRDQLDLSNKGSTLNAGNKIVFHVNGRDATELAAEFDNTPPPPERRMEPVYRALGGQEGLYTTGDGKVYQEIEGPRRAYNDVQAERANGLTNLPKYQAMCKLVAGEQLVEHRIRTLPIQGAPQEGVAVRIREESRKYGRPRAAVEEGLRQQDVISPHSVTNVEEVRKDSRT